MSDIVGDAVSIQAAEKIENAIEHVGYTSSQQQVGKLLEITETGLKTASKDTVLANFAGVVKAVTSEAEGSFAKTKVLGNPVTGANPTYAPYYLGNVTVLAGQKLTVERNCISFVLAEPATGDNAIKFGDPVKCADEGKIAKATAAEVADGTAIGRAYTNQADNRYDVVKIRVRAF